MKGSEQSKKPRATKLKAPSNASSHKAKVSRAFTTHSDSVGILPATMSLRQMLEKLKPHDHLCLIYETPKEWQMAIIPFTKIGLEHGEKCCYFADAHTAEQLRGYLQAEGVDVASAEASGQLVILCESEAYTKEGSFDPDLMISLLITETEKAIAEGYPALRLTGEMTWVLHGLPGSERLIEYEAKLNRDFYSKYPALGICQYDRWKFDPEIIRGIVMTHPLLVRGNYIYHNFYYIPTDEFLNAKRAELEVQHWLNNLEREQRVQQSLRESEEKYRSLVENSNVAIASIDLEGKIIFANEALLNLFGYAENEILGKPFYNFIHPDDLQPVMELFLAAPTDLREAIELEFRAVDKQGHDIDMYASMTQMKKDSEIIGFNAIMADITERKKVEERLLFTRFLVDSAADTMACIDQEARFVDVNNAFCRAVGYSREELFSMTVHDIDPDYSAEVWPEFWKKLKQSGSLTFESYHHSKEGRIIPVEIMANYFEYAGKEYHCAFARDITERKKAEETLRKYAYIISTTKDFMSFIDKNYVYQAINEANCKAHGKPREDIIGHSVAELWGQETFEKEIKCHIDRCLAGEEVHYDLWLDYPALGKRYMDVTYYPFFDSNGTIPGAVICSRDITERKKAEEKFRLLYEDAPLGYQSLDYDGNLIEVNKAWLDMFGYSTRKEVIGRRFSDFIAPEYLEDFKKNFPHFKESGECHGIEYEMVRKDGSRIAVSIDGKIGYDKQENFQRTHCILADITQRKQAEEELKQSEQKYQSLIEGTRAGMVSMDTTGKLIYINKAICEISGYSEEHLIGKPFIDFVHPDDKTKTMQLFLDALAKPQDRIDEDLRVILRDGQVIYIQIYISQIKANNEIIGFNVVIVDVTQRKQAEKELELRAQLLDNATDFIFLRDLDENFVYANETALKVLGYSREEFLKLKVRQTIAPGYPYTKASLLEELLAKGTITFETADLCKDGSIIPVEAHTRLIEMGGEKFVLSTVRDITERKRLEWSLQKNERRLKEAEKLGKLGNWEFDPATQKIEWSDEVYRLYQRDKALGPPTPEEEALYYAPEAAKRLREFSRLAVEKGKAQKYDVAANLPSGRTAFFHCTMQPIKDDQGQVTKLFGTVQDITERKQAEKQYKTIIQASIDSFWIIDMEGHFLDINDAYCNLTGYSREELLNMSIPDIEAIETKEETAQRIQRIAKTGGARFETRHRRKDGRIIDVEVSNDYIDIAGGRIFAFIRDITERKQAESELLKSQQELRNFSARLQHLREQERTNLAREIHDELGQALTALKMDLSWLSSRLPEENEALHSKAASMSQVIGATTETVRRMSTELRPGLLDDLGLIAAMEWQTTEFAKRTGIKCKLVFKPEEIAVERDMATAFFRIFQEVLTNVARHSQATKVTASLKEKAGTLELMVSDNGRGIANEEISSSKSLGLTGIRERVYHLKGKVEIKGKPGKGTTVKVRIARSQPDDKDISG